MSEEVTEFEEFNFKSYVNFLEENYLITSKYVDEKELDYYDDIDYLALQSSYAGKKVKILVYFNSVDFKKQSEWQSNTSHAYCYLSSKEESDKQYFYAIQETSDYELWGGRLLLVAIFVNDDSFCNEIVDKKIGSGSLIEIDATLRYITPQVISVENVTSWVAIKTVEKKPVIDEKELRYKSLLKKVNDSRDISWGFGFFAILTLMVFFIKREEISLLQLIITLIVCLIGMLFFKKMRDEYKEEADKYDAE